MKTETSIARTTWANTLATRLRTACATRLLPLLFLLTLPAAVQAQTYTQQLRHWDYTDNGDGTAIITGYTGSGGAVTIPSSILVNGVNLPVTGIGDYAFRIFRQQPDQRNRPNSVTSIGDFSFFLPGLTNVMIPNGVASIGDDAFDRLHQPNQHHHPQQRHQHRGGCVLWLHQPDQRYDRHQCD